MNGYSAIVIKFFCKRLWRKMLEVQATLEKVGRVGGGGARKVFKVLRIHKSNIGIF
jgi:hypothetical protein